MDNSIVALVFALLSVVIGFLLLQVNQHGKIDHDSKENDQKKLKEAALKYYTSLSQGNKFEKAREILYALFIIDCIVDKYNGIASTEKILKLDKGYLKLLYNDIKKSDEVSLHYFTSLILQTDPDISDKIKESTDEPNKLLRFAGRELRTTSSVDNNAEKKKYYKNKSKSKRRSRNSHRKDYLDPYN